MGSTSDDKPSGPIFVAGQDRSGLALIAAVLNSHPEIFLSRRTHFWSRFYGRFGDLSDPSNVAVLVAAMAEQPHLRELGIDPPRLVEELASIVPGATYPLAFELVHQHHLELIGKRRWGDKTAGTERHADLVFAAYPDARVIHVVRDPRDRYASHSLHRSGSRGGVGAGTARWLASVRLLHRNLGRYQTRYTMVRYEDLVDRPEAVIRDLCVFLGEQFVESMLEVPSVPQRGGSRPRPDQRRNALVPTSVGRFRTDLSAGDVAFIELVARRPMRDLGYRIERQRMGFANRASWLMTSASRNVVGMAAWWVRDHVRSMAAWRSR